MLRRYRHIIWDWNGTLLDDLDLCIDIMNGLLRKRSLPLLDRTRYHAIFDFPVRNYYSQLGLDSTDEGFRALSVEFISAYDQRRFETALHPGVDAILAAIQKAGWTQSILSAYRHETLCEIVSHFGLTSRFTRLSGLDNIYAQSKVDLGRRCLAELGVPPNEVLLVGDTLHDFDVAESLGVDCVLIAHGHHPLDRLQARCPQVLPNLSALAAELGLGKISV